MYFFTSDEHYGHYNMIKYCNRPFDSSREMDDEIVNRHNEIVSDNDIVVHAGDFTLAKKQYAQNYIRRLNGTNIFLKGSHDRWNNSATQIWEKRIGNEYIVVCHYAMRTWPRSHYGSWQLYGHSHGGLPPIGKQWDIGVDNNDFYPVSFERLKEIMSKLDDNPGVIRKTG